ncbi:WecB/TagA/CpsF family glycosyltransferase [Mariniblastus sp.]|nr:WecB/TagA/CpsF family glycosyltransferase [Mariniblastus sp.]
MTTSYNILNCRFDAVSEAGAAQWAKETLRAGKRGHISTVNVAILMMMRSDARLKQYIDDSGLIVADGQPLIWLSKLMRKPLPKRVAGVELVHELVNVASQEQAGIYLMGAKQDIVEDVAKNLTQQTPNAQIVGVQDGYFTQEESAARAQAIRESGAKLLIVAMRVPRQEQFLQDHWEDLNVQLAIGVGGSFDVIAGRTKRAPQWMQTVGLEWFFRMSQEPKRLAKRYFVTNSQFIWLSGWALLGQLLGLGNKTVTQSDARQPLT